MDDLIDKDKVPSRSFVIREAVRRYLKELENEQHLVFVFYKTTIMWPSENDGS